jgi:hypothetical protein
MKSSRLAAWFALVPLLAGAASQAQNGENQGTGQAVVTVLPKHDGEVAPSVANQDLAVQVNGKNAKVTKWAPYNNSADKIELVVLVDGSARSSLGTQLSEIESFVKALPPNVESAIAYMQEGRAIFAAPLSLDHQKVLSALHLPAGSAGSNSSPYFCISDLAQHWPSNVPSARREVVVISDGVDPYNPRFDPEDQYVESAIRDAVKARLVVYSIYWMDRGRADGSAYQNNAGQSLMMEVTDATGGKGFWEGMGNPVSFEPFLDELTRRFRNQYELSFVSPLKGKASVETMKLKLSAPGESIDSPKQVLIVPAAAN